MSDEGDEGRAWLDQLEATVKQAAGTIEALRRERGELATRVEELEARAQELEGAGGSEEAGAKAGAAAAAWREERKEIRRRVRKLTERLEGLLEG